MVKYSIIIPVFNNKEILIICLEKLKKQIDKKTEIIVVDDGSTQKGIKLIVKKFTPFFFRLKKNMGPGMARNFGVKKARGEWLIFLDSDIAVSHNFMKRVINKTSSLPLNVCLQGVYGWQTPINSFYSQYKNLYYYYNFFYRIKKERYSSLSSHCFVIRKKTFEAIGGFNKKIKTVIEDADLGFRLFQNGCKVLLDKKIVVTHLKEFTFSGLLVNDAKLSFAKAKHVLRNTFEKDKERLIVVSGGRASEMYVVILDVFLAPIVLFFIINFFWSRNGSSMCLLVFLVSFMVIINLNFFKMVGSKKGLKFLLKMGLLFYFDMLFAFIGFVLGILDYFLFNKKY